MKQIFKFGIFFLAVFIAFSSSCTKDVFTEEDAYANQEDLELLKDSLANAQAQMNNAFAREMELLRDSLQKAGGIIDYSVIAVLASDASWLSYYYDDKGGSDGKGGSGMDGIVVTVSQYGQLLTSTTNASGIATFSDLRIGSATVNVKKDGYCEVDFIAVLPALLDSVYADTYSLVRQAGTMVPMFSLTEELSTISGIAQVETDLTNDAPEPAANVKITATIDVDDHHFYNRYIQMPYSDVVECDYCSYWGFDYYALIRQIAFHSTVFEGITAADGSFSLQVPSTPDGLPYELSADEFAVNQSLLQATLNNIPVWGVQSVRTMFGPPSALTYSTIPTNGTGLSNVQSAYVTFSAPTGSPDAQPTEVAEATAVLTSSGLVSVNMTSEGEGYTQAPRVYIEPGTGYNPVQAEGTAVVSGGKVTGVTITNAGSGYAPGDVPAVIFEETVETVASADAEFSWSVVDITLDAIGDGYTGTPPDVTIVGTGTGATAHAVMGAYITEINMTAMGSGYTAMPLVNISDNFSSWGDASAIMTEDNPLHSITYDGTNTTLWTNTPNVTIVGDGANANATAVLDEEDGRIVGYDPATLVGGSGYNAAPLVSITGGGGFGATAYAEIAGDAVSNIVITDPGQGYDGSPTFVFTPVDGGSGASASPLVGYFVESITLGDSGEDYNSVTSIELNVGAATAEYITDCIVLFDMGVREIDVDWSGYYFASAPSISFTSVDGNGTGAAATAVIEWEIRDLVIDTPGSGYVVDDDNDVTVVINPPAGAGTQAEASAVMGNGVLSGVELYQNGQGYTAPPNVFILQDDGEGGSIDPVVTSTARITAAVSNGSLTGLTITDPGSGYDFDVYVAYEYFVEITTFNSEAEASAEANPESGQIDHFLVTNPGAGYVVAPKIEIIVSDTAAANGFGSGAAATATIVDGRVAEITVTNAGSGYYVTPAVNITVPFSSMTAVGRCAVTSDGRITGVEFTGGYPYTQGYGYAGAPTVTFAPSVPGKGSGAEGVAVVTDGRVTNVIMTNQGSGYIGKNNPNAAKASAFYPSASVMATASKAYVRDIDFGTGKRTVEQ